MVEKGLSENGSPFGYIGKVHNARPYSEGSQIMDLGCCTFILVCRECQEVVHSGKFETRCSAIMKCGRGQIVRLWPDACPYCER